MIRLPFGPLEREVGNRIGRTPTNADLMNWLVIEYEPMIPRYRANGLSVWTADIYAIRIGLHPISVWGLSMWMEGLTDAELGRDPDYPMPKIVNPW